MYYNVLLIGERIAASPSNFNGTYSGTSLIEEIIVEAEPLSVISSTEEYIAQQRTRTTE